MENCNINFEEFCYYLHREYKKLTIVFSKIKFLGSRRDIWELVISYWKDCQYFYSKKDYVKAFELINYIWGMLDVLANLELILIPEEIKKWFKI